MGNNLYPSFVRINYHSEFGPHAMTLPTLRWTAGLLGEPGEFDTHDGFGIASDVMVEALVAKLKAFYPVTANFDSYIVFNAPTLSVPLVFNPVYQKLINVAGTDVAPDGASKAVQFTVGLRTVTFGRSQIVLLDRPSGDTWGNVTTPDAITTALIDEFTAVSNGWAGRDNGRPFTFTNVSISLNKRLRREYHMI